ncbi:MAG: M50 family metallopeptidase, partial [Candidatus Marsarchaeota archaeon]|nr:M50 family metallopeptidase [Candidatus Marsarchaeota archaeon]
MSDIRSGMAAAELMQKYRLSAKGLDALFRKLVGAGLLHQNELDRLRDDPVRAAHVAWKCPACGAAQTREYAECPQCGVIVAKFQSRQSGTGDAERQPETFLSQPTPLPSDAPSGGWVELETGNGRFSRELSVAPHGETTAAPVTGRLSAGPQFHDYQEDQATGIDDESESTIPEPQTLDRTGWMMLLVGPVVALACFAFFWFRWILETFKTLVHEMGHAIFGWLFGYPSFPAFDVIWGGGVTIHTERSTLLCILIYAGFAGLFWVYRKNRGTLIVLTILVLIYSVCAFTSIHSVLILFMGHGTELVIAGLFIYRS